MGCASRSSQSDIASFVFLQHSFKQTTQQRAEAELAEEGEPLNNGASVFQQQADALRAEGFSADVPEQEEQVKLRLREHITLYECIIFDFLSSSVLCFHLPKLWQID